MKQVKFFSIFISCVFLFCSCSKDGINQPQLATKCSIIPMEHERSGYSHNLLLSEFLSNYDEVSDTVTLHGLLNLFSCITNGIVFEDATNFMSTPFVTGLNRIMTFEEMDAYIDSIQENILDDKMGSQRISYVYRIIDENLSYMAEDSTLDEIAMSLKIDSLYNRLETYSLSLADTVPEKYTIIEIASIMLGSFEYWCDASSVDEWTVIRHTLLNDTSNNEGDDDDKKTDEEKEKEEQKKFKEKVTKCVKADVAGACIGSLLGPGGSVGVGAITSGMAILASKE